jgi:hypothetical protein
MLRDDQITSSKNEINQANRKLNELIQIILSKYKSKLIDATLQTNAL